MPDAVTVAPESLDLVARAKRILAGEILPPPLPLHEVVRQFLGTLEGEALREATAAARQEILNDLNLQAHYGGNRTAYFTAEGGLLVVLASGDDQVKELYTRLTPDEKHKVLIENL
ncbi:MAG: hypothetical protein ACRC33_20405 [Gemmataceae bacterium]